MRFADRFGAGQALALKLQSYQNNPDTIVIGLPRGGVIVAQAISQYLGLALDIVVPRKIGAPDNPEFAIGAIAPDDGAILDQNIIKIHHIPEKYINEIIQQEKLEIQRRLKLYRGNQAPPILKNKTIILVDDGIATGATILASAQYLKKQGAKKIIIAVPVLPNDATNKIKNACDKLVYLSAPTWFMAVGNFYDDFQQVTDQEIVEIFKNPGQK